MLPVAVRQSLTPDVVCCATSSLAACQASSRRQITASQYADLLQAAQQTTPTALASAAPATPLIDDDATMETDGALDLFVARPPTAPDSSR